MSKLNHAKHNERVCNFLSKKEDFTDWIITTAFYSAIHFVDHKIFPFEEAGFKFTSIEQYFTYWKVNDFPSMDKHSIRDNLVITLCPEISTAFSWLRAQCYTARYHDYNYTRPRVAANQAKDYLKHIKDYCVKQE